MAVLCSRIVGAFGTVLEHLGVDTSRVGRFSSFQLVGGVVEFLHREWLHCVLVLFVLVLVFCVRASSSLTCRDPRKILRTHPQYPRV